MFTKKLLPLFILVLALTSFLYWGCSQKQPEFSTFPKFDSHVHVRIYDPAIVQQAIADNFRFLTICTGSSSQAYIDEQLKFYKFLNKKYPHRVFFSTTFSMEKWGQPQWQQETIDHLKKSFREGAVAVKVWKDIGMTFRDADSNFIMIDNPAFDPILDFIASQGKTVVAHLGEPRNCWLPLDSMTVNSDRGYYSRHPEYHMYLHPDYPSYQDQIDARDHMLEKHPNLTVIGAHLGSLEWNVDELAKRLDRFPNFAVDMAARICHFQVQDREKVRNFIIKYQDRLLYATDLSVKEGQDYQASARKFHEVWLADWRYFTTDEEMTSNKVNSAFRGLKLQSKVLKKIYFQNARKWIPGMSF